MQNQDHCEMLPVGTTLQMGKYRVESYLASGGFGNTYVVMNTMFEKRMAMKEFFMSGVSERNDHNTVSVSNATNQASFDGQRKKFKKEAQRLNNLHNDHIVQVYDLFDENGTTYYVMDFINGESLSKHLKRTGKPMTEHEVLNVLNQVLNALETVHAQGLWHLDLKPSNIMVDNAGTAKLIDFGASKQMNAGDGYTTTTTAMCYTPGYAPLEQIDQKMELIGPWTDLYALGATLYNMLTCKQPPMGSELHEDNAFAYPEGVSERTRQLIRWMMNPVRSRRPQSVAEVRAFLTDESGPQQGKSPLNGTARQAKGNSADNEKTVLNVKNSSKTPKGKKSHKQQGFEKEIKKMTTPLYRKRKLIAGIAAAALIVIPLVLWMALAKGEKNVNNEPGTQHTEDVPDINLTPEWSPENKTYTVNGVSFTMIPVEGGTFTMRDENVMDSVMIPEDDIVKCEISVSSYYIGETEVTQALWEAVMGSNPSKFKGARRPVDNVSYDDCQAFIRKLNAETGQHFHLPTEAQWHFAAMGGKKTHNYQYAGNNGDNLHDVAWFDMNSGYSTHNVASLQSNELGIYDMTGNLNEWCYDWYGELNRSPQTNPIGPTSGSSRVIRGGSWNDDMWVSIVPIRNFSSAGSRSDNLGFRLAL